MSVADEAVDGLRRHDRPENARKAENEQHRDDVRFAVARLREDGTHVGIGRELPEHGDGREEIELQKRGALQEPRQGGERPRLVARALREHRPNEDETRKGRRTDYAEGFLPAEEVPELRADRNPQNGRDDRSAHHGRKPHGAFSARGHAGGKGRHDRPEDGMRECHPDSGRKERLERVRPQNDHVAKREDRNEAEKKLAALDLGGEKRQG